MDKEVSLNLYQAIKSGNINAETYLLTVLDGDEIGEKAVVTDHKMTWASDEDGFLRKHEETLTAGGESGVFELDGRSVFRELLGSDKEIVICGGGHVSMPIITIGRMMGFQVTVIEDRPMFANNARRQGATKVICDSFEKALETIGGNADTFFIIVTRGHRYDKECLRSIAKKPHAYIGMIGSRRRVGMVKETLAEEGISREVLDSVYTPIGLDIGAETPEEIAVAIMAEVIEVKNKKKRNFGIPKDIMKVLLSDERDPMMMATIITRKGSAPREVGTKMLIRKDGSTVGTIGGGCVESDIMTRAREILMDGEPQAEIRHVDMTGTDDAENDGMVCGGIIDVLLEIV